MAEDLQDFIQHMPKAELHVHLEGCLTPTLARTLAKRNDLPLPAHLKSLDLTEGYDFNDLTSFLAIYYPNLSVLETEDDFRDLALDYLAHAHKQHVVHAEMFFDPQAHTSRGIPFGSVVRGYHSGLVQGQKRYGISASLIMCFLRDHSAESAMATLTDALAYKNMIIGVGLDSDERDNPPSKFAEVFARARQEGFHLTMHCDIDQQNTLEHIRQALMDVNVERIDHGENIIDSPELLETLKTRGIGLTCTPISNSVVSPDFKGKEILSLLRQGVKVTVSSDDPPYFRGYMNENMMKMANETDITKPELLQLHRNAFEISWLPPEKRDHFLEAVDMYGRLDHHD